MVDTQLEKRKLIIQNIELTDELEVH